MSKAPANHRACSPLDEQIALRLRHRRLECGLTQTALADAIGVSFQQIQKYERCTNRVSASRLYLLAQALIVPISYFFDPLPYELPKTPMSRAHTQWNQLYDQLSPDARRKVRALARHLAEP